jgi:hypothetical protein
MRRWVLIPRKERQRYKAISPNAAVLTAPVIDAVGKAFEELPRFEPYCLTGGLEALDVMMEKDAEDACGGWRLKVASPQLPHVKLQRLLEFFVSGHPDAQ